MEERSEVFRAGEFYSADFFIHFQIGTDYPKTFLGIPRSTNCIPPLIEFMN